MAKFKYPCRVQFSPRLQWQNMLIVVFQITNNSTVCSEACSGDQEKYIKAPHHWPFVRDVQPLTPSQNGSNTENLPSYDVMMCSDCSTPDVSDGTLLWAAMPVGPAGNGHQQARRNWWRQPSEWSRSTGVPRWRLGCQRRYTSPVDACERHCKLKTNVVSSICWMMRKSSETTGYPI